MKIYYEDSMPFAEYYFSELGQCESFSSQTIKPETLIDADVLLVRSTTNVNQSLLHLAKQLKYVSTATAGSDHIDKPYLDSIGLAYGDAGGCNAIAVAEYVLSCLLVTYQNNLNELLSKRVGIVGAGHVGSALASRLKALGIEYLLCDPPLQTQGDKRTFHSLDEVCACDIISLHVPYVREGEFPTKHMFDKGRMEQLSDQQLLINACRGGVLDNAAALALFQSGSRLNIILDVWENEPNVNFALVPYVKIATQHIAGHTLEGKARGTFMLYEQLCQRFGFQTTKTFSSCLPDTQPIEIGQADMWQQIKHAGLTVYNVSRDSEGFKRQVTNAKQFIYSRKHYAIRREFASMSLKTGNFLPTKALYRLGFSDVVGDE